MPLMTSYSCLCSGSLIPSAMDSKGHKKLGRRKKNKIKNQERLIKKFPYRYKMPRHLLDCSQAPRTQCSEELGLRGEEVHGAPEEPCAVANNLALPSSPAVSVHVKSYIFVIH